MTLPIGAALQNGHYVLDSVTHQDDTGTTYRGTHVLSGQVVSIKLLGDTLPQYLESFLLRAEFVDQIQRLAQLQHPHVVSNLHCFEEDGLLFVAMATDVGQSLAQIVGANSPLPEPVALNYLSQIADALAVVRQVGLKHLDLDPRLIFRKSGTNDVVLTGFGFSLISLTERKPLQSDLPPPRQSAYSINSAHTPIIKANSSDIYKLASLLYYLLSGQSAASGGQRAAKLSWPKQRVISNTTKQAIQLGLGLPDEAPISALQEWLTLLPNVSGPCYEAWVEPPVFEPYEPVFNEPVFNEPVFKSDRPVDKPIEIAAVSPIQSKPTSQTSIQSPGSTQAPVLLPTNATISSALPAANPVKSVKPVKSGSRIRNLALIMTIFVSALTGLGFGTALRFGTPSSQPRRIRFDPDQSFPPLEDWVEDQPAVDFDSPYLPSEDSLSGPSRARRTNHPPRSEPSGAQSAESTARKEGEFDWLEQDSVIPDYPDPKQPRSSLGSWPTYPETAYPETVSPSNNAPTAPQSVAPAAEPFPPVAPSPTPTADSFPSTGIPEVLDNAVESPSEPAKPTLPTPAPAPIIDAPPAILLDNADEPVEPANPPGEE